MEMKKIVCVTLIAAASMSSVMAQIMPSISVPVPAPAPAPSSDAPAILPHVATLAGATLFSFATYYLH